MTNAGYEARRQEILTAALDIFSTHGFEGTTLEAVADTLGYTKPALYYYFHSKEDLFCSLILDSLRAASLRIADIFAQDKTPSGKLRDLIRLYLDDHFSNRGYFSITHLLKGFKDSMPEGEAKAEIERLSRGIHEPIMATIAQGIALGEFKDEDPKLLGSIVFAMLSGILIHIEMPALSGISLDKLKSCLDEIIVKGISP